MVGRAALRKGKRRDPQPAQDARRTRRASPSCSPTSCATSTTRGRAVEIDARAARDTGRSAADRLHRPRGPPQLRLLPGRRDQPVRPDQPPAALHRSSSVGTGPCRPLQTPVEPGTPRVRRPERRRRDGGTTEHPRRGPLRRLARPQPAGHQPGPRPAALRRLGLPRGQPTSAARSATRGISTNAAARQAARRHEHQRRLRAAAHAGARPRPGAPGEPGDARGARPAGPRRCPATPAARSTTCSTSRRATDQRRPGLRRRQASGASSAPTTSSTSSSATDERRRRHAHRGARDEGPQPVPVARRLADDGRRDHDADRDRRRLPRLQREQRPAVRARLPGLGRAPERRPADATTTRSGSAATGSASSSRSRRSTPRRRGPSRPADAATDQEVSAGVDPDDAIAQLNLKLDKTRRAAARRTRRSGSATAPRSGSSTSRSRAATASRRAEGCTSPRRPRPRRADRVRRHRQHLRHRDARATPRINLVGFGNAFAGRGASLNQAIEALNPLFTNLKPVARVLADPHDPARPLLPGARRRARGSSPRSPRSRRSCSTNTAIAFAAISEDPRGAARTTISEGPPTLRDGHRHAARASSPSCATSPTLSRAAAPRRPRPAPTLPTLNDALVVGTPSCARTPRDQPRPRARLRASSSSSSSSRRRSCRCSA